MEDNTFKFNYYRKEYAFLSRTSDFIKLRKKLKVYYILEGDQALNATIKLIEKVQELMNIQAVNDSIRYVKNKLLKNECNKIEGAELEKLIIEVKRTTQRVLFENVLNQFVKEI